MNKFFRYIAFPVSLSLLIALMMGFEVPSGTIAMIMPLIVAVLGFLIKGNDGNLTIKAIIVSLMFYIPADIYRIYLVQNVMGYKIVWRDTLVSFACDYAVFGFVVLLGALVWRLFDYIKERRAAE